MVKRLSQFISVLVITTIILQSCDFIKMKQEEEVETNAVKPIAKVYDQFLYPDNLKGLIAEGISPEDSAGRVENYIKTWIRKQLMAKQLH